MNVEAVIFDLDDTLVALEAAKTRAFSYAASHGFDLNIMKKVELNLWRQFAQGEVSYEELSVRRWTDLGATYEQALQLNPEFRDLCNAVYCRPGARKVLQTLREKGYKLGLLSNATSKYQRIKLASTKLEYHLDAVGISEELGVAKPNPRAYQAVCEMLGVPPDRTVMVGDDLRGDIFGALQAGLAGAVWYPRQGFRIAPVLAEHPELTYIRRLEQLPELLSGLPNKTLSL